MRILLLIFSLLGIYFLCCASDVSIEELAISNSSLGRPNLVPVQDGIVDTLDPVKGAKGIARIAAIILFFASNMYGIGKLPWGLLLLVNILTLTACISQAPRGILQEVAQREYAFIAWLLGSRMVSVAFPIQGMSGYGQILVAMFLFPVLEFLVARICARLIK